MSRAPTEMEIAACRKACHASPAIGRAVPCLAPRCPCMNDTCLPMVRAVIDALRDPTPGMLAAGGPHCMNENCTESVHGEGNARNAWRDMIDAASPPEAP